MNDKTSKASDTTSSRTLTLRKETVRAAAVRSGVKAGARSTTLRCTMPGTVVYTTCGSSC